MTEVMAVQHVSGACWLGLRRHATNVAMLRLPLSRTKLLPELQKVLDRQLQAAPSCLAGRRPYAAAASAGRAFSSSSSSSSSNGAGPAAAVLEPDPDAAAASANGAGGGRIVDVELVDEMQSSYVSYAMSVIVGRALPDVRDGLKPVHRRILYAMHDLGLVHTKPYRKCARVVGEVLGKYHPHGDTAVYDALVRMAQDFSMRNPLIAGHGNFGSMDNDPPAAMRYTECRLRPLASAMLLADLGADTVDFSPNFDASEEEPDVMPARLPNLLINGSAGIAVGIATKIPPHNLREVVAGLRALIADPDISVAQLQQHIPGPDFPTGGEIIVTDGIRTAYHEGRGSITMRGRAHIEDGETSASKGSRSGKKGGRGSRAGKPSIIITELPYQTNKAAFVEEIVRLADAGTIPGVSGVRDESDRDGMRVVVELKAGLAPQVVLNNLYKHTGLQTRFACNMVALANGRPVTLNLKEFLTHFRDFRCEAIRRRARYDLARAQKRLHLVEGLLIAIKSMDQVVATVRAARDGAEGSEKLQAGFGLSREQAEGVLGMTLRRLTGLEEQKLETEHAELTTRVADLQGLLGSPQRVLAVLEAEAVQLAEQFGEERRTKIQEGLPETFEAEDVTPNQQSLIMVSQRGYIKRMPSDVFTVQKRGGKGKAVARLRTDDTVDEVVRVMDHDHLLFLSSDGTAFCIRAHQVPAASRTSVGVPIQQVLPMAKGGKLAAMLPVSGFREEDHLVMLSRSGQIKRTPLTQFAALRSSGIIAMKLREGDELMWVAKCTERCSVLVGSSSGKVIRFATDNAFRASGRASMGIKAMKLPEGVSLVGMSVLPENVTESGSDGGPWALFVTASGRGKRVPMASIRQQARAAQGATGIKLRDGDRLAAVMVVGYGEAAEQQEVLLGSAQGLVTRTSLAKIPVLSRTAQGVRVMNMQEGDEVVTVTPLQQSELPVADSPATAGLAATSDFEAATSDSEAATSDSEAELSDGELSSEDEAESPGLSPEAVAAAGVTETAARVLPEAKRRSGGKAAANGTSGARSNVAATKKTGKLASGEGSEGGEARVAGRGRPRGLQVVDA